jgi:uncharacterized protein (DUF488 family)
VIDVCTIGFTQKSAEHFFTLLRGSGTRTLLDVRLNNSSQLAGFAKRQDLPFFLRELCGIEYEHLPELAPTAPMLSEYRGPGGSWDVYRERFLDLLAKRNVERGITKEQLHGSCLLCSEHEPAHCHRQLVLDYLNPYLGTSLRVRHLL